MEIKLLANMMMSRMAAKEMVEKMGSLARPSLGESNILEEEVVVVDLSCREDMGLPLK